MNEWYWSRCFWSLAFLRGSVVASEANNNGCPLIKAEAPTEQREEILFALGWFWGPDATFRFVWPSMWIRTTGFLISKSLLFLACFSSSPQRNGGDYRCHLWLHRWQEAVSDVSLDEGPHGSRARRFQSTEDFACEAARCVLVGAFAIQWPLVVSVSLVRLGELFVVDRRFCKDVLFARSSTSMMRSWRRSRRVAMLCWRKTRKSCVS